MFNKVFGFIFFLGIFVFGAYLFYFSINRVILVYESKDWVETSAQVIYSKVCRTKGIKSTTYEPNIIYRYEVAGKYYESKVITYGFVKGNEAEAVEKVSLYPVDSQVKAFYNPHSPEQSCLETGGSIGGFSIPIGLSILIMTFGLWAAKKTRKETKRLYRKF